MRRFIIDKDIQPLSTFRAKTSAMMRQVYNTKRPLILTQRGKSSAVVLDVGEYEKLLEKLEILQDIHLAEEQLKEGKGTSHEQALAQVLHNLHQ